MDIKDFIAISGQPGLYKMVSQGKSILIAENLETGQRIPVHASSHVNSMEEITVFTKTEDKPLKEVFFEIYQKEDGKTVLDPKKSTNDQIMEYFTSVLPTYDRNKVYLSDMKKIFLWYNILVTSGKIDWTMTDPAGPEAVGSRQ
ncbi:MAG: hypothetical protein D4R64_17730 [Porphyromonadaceae bacterium]|nr:MAG: hypothetical protein D4R64_17730 [Porphyromonadaceae bacterium]